MMPTGSAVERAIACPASCALSRAGHSGVAAVAGVANHKAIEDGDLSNGAVRRLLDAATDVRHEVAYALDVERCTVREIGVGVGRSYGLLGEDEVALTIDAEFRIRSQWWVVDWKSRGRVASAAFNPQVRCGGLAVMANHATDSVVTALVYLDDGEIDEAPFDVFDARTFWADLRGMRDRIRAARRVVASGGVPDVNSGAHCTYCPSLPYCPAHTRLALSMLGELDGVDKAIGELTVDQCGRAWELLKRYETIAERVRETIRERAKRETVPLSNGRRLAMVECKGRLGFDQKKAKELLAGAGLEPPMKRGESYYQVKEVKLSNEEVIDG